MDVEIYRLLKFTYCVIKFLHTIKQKHISVHLSKIAFPNIRLLQTMTLKMTSGEDEESEEEDENAEEESGSEQLEEGEISDEDEGNVEIDEKRKEDEGENQERETVQEVEIDESAKVEVEEGKFDDSRRIGKESREIVNGNESGSDQQEGNEKLDEGEAQNHEVEGNGEEILEDTTSGNSNDTEECAQRGNDDEERLTANSGDTPVTTEDASPLPATNYSDSEGEDIRHGEVPLLGDSNDLRDNKGIKEQEGDDSTAILEDNASSEEDLDTISNRPVLGSEHASISSSDNILERNSPDNNSQGSLGSDLQNVDEQSPLSTASLIVPGRGESKEVDVEIENESKIENAILESGVDPAVKSEANVATEEKIQGEKKITGLSE